MCTAFWARDVTLQTAHVHSQNHIPRPENLNLPGSLVIRIIRHPALQTKLLGFFWWWIKQDCHAFKNRCFCSSLGKEFLVCSILGIFDLILKTGALYLLIKNVFLTSSTGWSYWCFYLEKAACLFNLWADFQVLICKTSEVFTCPCSITVSSIFIFQFFL